MLKTGEAHEQWRRLPMWYGVGVRSVYAVDTYHLADYPAVGQQRCCPREHRPTAGPEQSKETARMSQFNDESSRRTFLKAGVAAVAAIGMADLLSASAQAASEVTAAPVTVRSGPAAQGMTIMDSHCHATPVWYADIDALVFEQDRNGVDHAVLVQIGNFFDNTYQFDALKRFPGRFANVVIGDYTKPDAADTLKKFADQGVERRPHLRADALARRRSVHDLEGRRQPRPLDHHGRPKL